MNLEAGEIVCGGLICSTVREMERFLLVRRNSARCRRVREYLVNKSVADEPVCGASVCLEVRVVSRKVLLLNEQSRKRASVFCAISENRSMVLQTAQKEVKVHAGLAIGLEFVDSPR